MGRLFISCFLPCFGKNILIKKAMSGWLQVGIELRFGEFIPALSKPGMFQAFAKNWDVKNIGMKSVLFRSIFF